MRKLFKFLIPSLAIVSTVAIWLVAHYATERFSYIPSINAALADLDNGNDARAKSEIEIASGLAKQEMCPPLSLKSIEQLGRLNCCYAKLIEHQMTATKLECEKSPQQTKEIRLAMFSLIENETDDLIALDDSAKTFLPEMDLEGKALRRGRDDLKAELAQLQIDIAKQNHHS